MSVLEVSDLSPLPGVACGVAPGLMWLRSLLEVGRTNEALSMCFTIIADWKKSYDPLRDLLASVQLAQTFLFGSVAAVKLKQFELAHLLAGR